VQAPFWSNHDDDRGLRLIDARFVRAIHDAGRRVHVWTINDVPTMRALIALGVDGITTDRPDLLAEALA
jgi:glycerophosphoryl diester phosphodiesterase